MNMNITKQGLEITSHFIEGDNNFKVWDTINPNLGNTSANYSNQIYNSPKATSSWGGDAGTVTFYKNGGYLNMPYKEYHKTATGTGGIYTKTANDIIIEAGKTYTMSVWIKGSRAFSDSAYSFNINRGSDNHYINYGKSVPITTEWALLTRTFTAGSDEGGSYGEMSIIYDDAVTDYYVYYSGFKIEEGSVPTKWTYPKELVIDTVGNGISADIFYEI